MIWPRNHRSLALFWTKEIPCSCFKAMWLQGPWSDRWPKMDAFPNVSQVYLYLSPPLSLSMSFAFEDDIPCVYPWCHAEGKSFSPPCLCGLVSHTARWQTGIAGSFWLLTEWCSPHDLWSSRAEDGPPSVCYLEIPELFSILYGERARLFCLCVCFLERLPVGFSDELVSEILPLRFNPVDNWAVMDQFYRPPFWCAQFQYLNSQMSTSLVSYWVCSLPDAYT